MDWQKALVYDNETNRDLTPYVKSIRKVDNDYYDIIFENGYFHYSASRISYFTKPQEIDSRQYIFVVNEIPMQHIKKILQFGHFLKFEGENGFITTVRESDVKRLKNVKENKSIAEVINYLSEVAILDRETEGSNDDASFLETQIAQMDVRIDSTLASFLIGEEVIQRQDDNPIIAPFASNASQLKAIKNALTSNISIIEGPPGTGKTQTILNIIANLLIRDKTIAVVSGNNEATRNVFEKLKEKRLGSICAELGNKDNRDQFFSITHSKDELKEMLSIYRKAPSNNEIKEIESKVNDFYNAILEEAETRGRIRELEIEKRDNDIAMEGKEIKPPRFFNKSLSSANCLKLAAYVELLYSKKSANVVKKIKMRFKFGFWPQEDFKPGLLIDYLQNRYYTEKLREEKEKLDELESRYPKENEETLLSSYQDISNRKLLAYLNNKYKGLKDKQFSSNSYRYASDFTCHFPVVLSTTHSIQACKPSLGLFDYVIVDEASQVGLSSAVLALASCKNIVIVGDSKQLPHVIQNRLIEPLKGIRSRYKLPQHIDYIKYSLLESVKKKYGASIPNTLLNEHYRCDPDIIGFCNKRFYNNALVIHTCHNKGEGITIIETPAHSALGRTNERQAKIILEEILPHVDDKKDLGVVAPYRAQVELIQKTLNSPDILVDTVHKFQGKERATMVLSTTSDRTVLYEDPECIDFLNNPNLINVAFSRAKNRLYIIASKEALTQKGTLLEDISRYCNHNLLDYNRVDTSVYSIFDLMTNEYNKILEPLKKKVIKISNFESENIMWALLKNICDSGQYGLLSLCFNYPMRKIVDYNRIIDEKDRAFVLNPNTHCDFVLYSLIDKAISLIIEVDGKQHEEETQRLRDERKDKILDEFHINHIRIKTTSVEVEETIRKALSQSTASK